ncbi:hypothetical protein TYRP_004540 [Tyrophagus putrescentiae]|nr:hypothetical protein TYRP_004540 [Tyrophagus putrescentiae]
MMRRGQGGWRSSTGVQGQRGGDVCGDDAAIEEATEQANEPPNESRRDDKQLQSITQQCGNC